MWPFKRRSAPRVESVRVGEISSQIADYPVLTVGQSRLGESFRKLDFTKSSDPVFTWALIVPIADPHMGTTADLEIRANHLPVGYLRPPALHSALALLDEHHAASLEIPILLLWTPAGPEVRVHHVVG
jgi:hypothetical protein